MKIFSKMIITRKTLWIFHILLTISMVSEKTLFCRNEIHRCPLIYWNKANSFGFLMIAHGFISFTQFFLYSSATIIFFHYPFPARCHTQPCILVPRDDGMDTGSMDRRCSQHLWTTTGKIHKDGEIRDRFEEHLSPGKKCNSWQIQPRNLDTDDDIHLHG